MDTPFKISVLVGTLRNSKANNIGTYQYGLSNTVEDGFEVGLAQL